MVVLNWKTGIGNITLDPGSSILVPFQDLPGLRPVPLPADTIAQPDEYGIYFKVESIDPLTSAVVFKVDSDGFKIPFGFTPYTIENLTDDDLAVIGYPPEAREDGTYVNALNLTTIRLGGGNDTFTLTGKGITQSPSAEVSKEASQGYIFQSNIFAGSGDDVVRVLMPWQSVFKGGSNTPYYDAIFGTDPGGGTAITLSDDLTLEEMSFGDLIELKGSRFDWDIEFKDGNGDGDVNLASILDERDYIAVSNNNRIYGFERLLFGDILFDLVLARQQDSNGVYGQPDYYLNGSEDKAPELNSTISQSSGLWEAFRFNRTKLEGITGTATIPISVHTGDAGDTPFLVGALRFASLQTEEGDDIAEIGSADQATVDLGDGSDQLKANVAFSRSTAVGGAGDDNIILTSISNSTISGGSGADIVDVRASATDSAFDGGADAGDTLLLPGPFADYALSASNSGGVVTFTDAFGNNFTGFQSIKFSDINLDALQTLSLTGPAAPVAEGATADYTIALGASGLGASGLARGESVAFRLQLGNGTAQVSSDLAALVQSSLQAAAGIVLRNVSVDAGTGLIRAVASASRDFSPAATIATLALPVSVDLQTEPDETFSVTLTDFVQAQSVTTTISNVLPVTIRLSGPTSVTEGQTASYAVGLDGVGLAAGRSATFVLDSIGGTATEGQDFAALIASSLQKADGITLSGISAAADGAVTVTATNTSGGDLAVGATLLTVSLPITTDATVEGTERFSITLASSTAVVSGALVTTTISDLVPTPTLALSGVTAATEGKSAAYAVALAGSSSDLLAGQSITLTLDSASGSDSGSATDGLDFAALISAGLTAGNGITFGAIATDPVSGAVTLTATNTSTGTLAAGSQLLSISIPTTGDSFAEGSEIFSVSLTSTNASVSTGSITTSITDNDPLTLRIAGPASVAEGTPASPYTVSLGSAVGLGAGRSVTFSLDSASGSATEELDFNALVAAGLTAATGLSLSPISIDPATGAITITATNTSGADLAAGSALVSFGINTTNDLISEANESFSLNLTGATGVTVEGPASVLTSITDDDAPALKLNVTGASSVAEGANASYSLALDGVGLGVGRSVSFTLDSASGTAAEGVDFAALIAAALNAASGITLSAISTAANGTITATATNTSGADLPVGSSILSFSLPANSDSIVEGTETYSVSLGGANGSGSITTAINDTNTAVISLGGSASVLEGANAGYAVSLDGVGLSAGQSISLTLDSDSGSATENLDFAALISAGLTAGNGITFGAIATDPVSGAVTLTATNTSTGTLAAGSQLLSISIPTTGDSFAEGSEIFSVSLTSTNASVSTGSITTSITDNDPLTLRIAGPASVAEGTPASPYTVSLGSAVGLGAGRSVTFSLDSASGSATEELDFNALVAAGLTAATGLSLSPISIDPATGAITITATNTSGADLAAGSALVSFGINTTNDLISEANESFSLNLTGATGVTVEGPASVLTSITDDDAPALKLNVTGASSVAEGANASYSLALDGVGLGVGRSVDFRLSTLDGSAREGSDFATLIAANLQPVAGVSLSNISTDVLGGITGRATNTGSDALAVNAELLSFSIAATADAVAEQAETYDVFLSSTDAAVSTATFTTSITDASLPVFRLTGSTAVTEGSLATYGVSLDGGIALGAGKSVTFTLDSQGLGDVAGLSATQGKDLAALVAAMIKPTPAGITLSNISTDPATGAITLTASNSSPVDLDAGSQIVSFELPTTNDLFVEGNETFRVSLTSTTATVTGADLTTTINDDDTPVIKLTGSDTVAEAVTAAYAVSLDGVGLGAGASVSFSLDSAGITATEGSDFAALVGGSLVAASAQLGLSTNPPSASGAVSVTITNNGADLAAGSKLLDIALPTTGDVLVEGQEIFALTLSSTTATVSAATINTTITDDDVAAISLNGPASVSEGAAASYTLALAGIGLGAGRSLTFSLDTASGAGAAGATEGTDFAALLASSLTPAAGISLSGISTAADGTVTLTVTNSSGAELWAGSALLNFDVATTQDAVAEASETFNVSLGGSNGTAALTTTITDNDPAAIRLTGAASVLEGANASYAVSLDGVGLGAGQSLTLTLDSASGTALETVDFAALIGSSLTAATGVSLSGLSTGALGAITLTATNTSGNDLDLSAQLLSFTIAASTDAGAETDETFEVTLSSSTASVASGAGLVTTTIENIGGLISRVTTQGADTLSPSQWLELNGEEPNAPPFAGITGSEKNPITVNTGDIANSVRLSDAIAFATLNTGADNDRVLVAFPPSRDLPYVQFGHGAYKATINTGAGNDVINIQSAANSAYVRSTPQDPPSYALPDYYDSIVDAGEGDDYVYGFLPYKTQFIGGSSTDTLFLYGRYSDWSVQTVDVTANGLLLSDASDDYSTWSAATTLSNTATENTVRGFEFVQFNDILLDLSEQLSLAGPASPVAEGASASYSIALAGNGLQQSQSVAFSLQLSDGTARLAADLAALTPSVLQGANGVSLQNVVVDATTGRITAVATATRSFSSGATIASLALPVQADLLAEPDETFNLTLGGFIQPQSVITTISNQDPLAIRLTGPGSVLEGATTTPYTVALDGVGLGAGASVSFSLDSASGSATEGLDFNALVAAGLTAATGITLSGITTAADGSIAVTATNTSGVDLITDAALLTLKIKTANDAVVEGDESFDLRLSSSSTAVSSATLSTTITDDDAPALKLTGSASIAEGAAASYSLALDGVGLGAGRSVTFTLDSASGSAAEGSDFSELAFADLQAGAGVKLKRLSTDPLTKAVTISATNVSGTDLATGAELLSVPIKTTNDRTAEGEETYVVNLSSNTVSVVAPALTTKIKDDDPVAIRLKGKTSVREGDAASYAIGLDGVGLGSGRSISLSVNTASESARQPTDFAALLPGALSPEAGVSLSGISTDPVTGALTLTMTNSSGEDLAANAQLLNVSIGTSDDTVVEGNETYAVNISKSTAALNGDTINTTITDDDTPVIKLTGSSTVQEGNTAAYAVSLDGVSLGAGQSLKLVLDTISGSATEGSDFAALVAAGLKAAPGLKLSDISIQASTKAVRLTVTNRSNTDLAVGAPLLNFTLNTIDDTTVEVTESYRVTLTSSTADVSNGSLTTTITDNDIATPVEPPSGGGGGNPASPGNQFLNGGKPEDILDSIFGKGRPRVRRKAAADPIVESRQRLMDTRSRRSADRTQNVAAMDDSTAISSIGSAVTVVTAPWQDPRLDGTTALPLGRSDNGTLQWL